VQVVRDFAAAATGAGSRHHVGSVAASGARAAGSMQRLVQTVRRSDDH